MAILNLQVVVKDSRVDDVKLCLERVIAMPTKDDPESTPENPLPQIPRFANTKLLVEWWLGTCLKRVAKKGDGLLRADEEPFDNDFIKE